MNELANNLRAIVESAAQLLRTFPEELIFGCGKKGGLGHSIMTAKPVDLVEYGGCITTPGPHVGHSRGLPSAGACRIH
jgi:hypothetical protein